MQNTEQAQPLPAIFIGTDAVQQKVEKYQIEKYPLLKESQLLKGVNRTETKSIWYSKEHIETLLSEISLMNAN